MNLPNYITLSRIASIPLIIWILTTPYFGGKEATLRVVLASGLFILASITDGLDGYLARRRGQITTMGMLLDPLADKLMIAACYITLVHLIPEIVNVWVVVLIIGREFLISGLRSIAASEGFTIEASELGKLKMVVQIVSVVAAILAIRWDVWHFNFGLFSFVLDVDLVARMAIWFMVAVSVISAVDYFWAFWKKIDKRVERRRRRPFILSRRKKKALQQAEASNPAKAH
ncbi:MAG TPA: CDP-diacylglycerol--glycerol-3-phosphate 3-phosphatidyltransferase [Candidatus Angelobacter sp.]|nr:CDP-diacylglycerol--glycerol-3-phosphate 3-phosphatidyltransferase [Candidatus Angelobacter sp.]